MQKLLIVEDDPSVRNTMVTVLELEGYQPEAVASTREAIERLAAEPYTIVISDIYLDERTGIDVLHAARKQNPLCAVILMTGRGSMETVMAATEGGAFEYLAKPFEMAQMIETIRRAEKSLGAAEDENDSATIDDLPDTEMIGSSPRMIEIYKTLSRVAPTDATVLIEGETGTGKELIAGMIHRNSKRSAAAVCAGGLRRDCAFAARKRTVRHAARRLHRSRPRPHGRVRRRPTTAPCSWTRSAISTWASSSSCCGFCRNARSVRWVRRARRRWTCA